MKIGKAIRNKFTNKENIDLFVHTIFNYIDKIVNLLSPLLVIKFLHNQLLYNKIEYILSSALILSVLIDFGLSSYYFYGYRQSEFKEKYILSVEKCFLLLYTVQVFLVIVLVSVYFVTLNQALIIYICLFIRTLFLSYTNFKFNTYRMIDRPSAIFFITIPVNLFAFSLFYILYKYQSPQVLYYFLVLFLFEIGYTVSALIKHKHFDIKSLWNLLKVSFFFAWPVMVNVFIINTIGNYGKIYAYQNLTPSAMTSLSLMQRFMVIITLAHTASNSFYLKKIFDTKEVKLDFQIFKKYTSGMISSTFLVVLCVVINNAFHVVVKLPLDFSFAFLTLFFVLSSYTGFLGTYFTVLNKNNLRMITSVITIVIYMGGLWLIKPVTLFQLTLIMLVTIVLNLFYIIGFLLNNKVIKFSFL